MISNYKNIITKEFLLNEYLINQKSTTQIGKQMGCSNVTISRYLIKYDIPRRNKAESVYLSRKKNFDVVELTKNYIDGLLIGDGSIINYNRWSALYFQGFALRYKDWAEKIKKDFSSFGIASKISKRTIPKRIIKTKIVPSSEIVILWTLKYDNFLLFRKRWYPNGVKNIPDDIEISPEFLSNWYQGDGSIHRLQKNIVISSLSFSRDDLLKVSRKINVKLNIKSVVHKTGIYINRKHAKLFLDYIEPYMVSCFDYKRL